MSDDFEQAKSRVRQSEGAYVAMRPLVSSWEQRKLGDLISVYIAHAGPEEDVTVLTSSRDGIQKQEDHFGRLQQHDTSDWNLIPYGYCTYRNRSDDGLFTFNVNKVADRGIVSKFYPVFETSECDADFLVAYLNSSQEIRKKLFVLAVGTSQVVLSYGALKELSLLLPQNREQSAIANVLNHIDNLITLHQRKYDKLCTVKKSMLDKMFPKPGETEPEIRFEGFTDPWEQRKLGDCVGSTYGGGTPSTSHDEYWGGNIPWIQSSNVLENELFRIDIPKAITQDGLSKSAALRVPGDSIAVVTHVGVGKLVYLPFPYATSQDFVSLSELKGDANFLCYAIHRKLQSELHMVQGSAIKGITKEELLGKAIFLPAAEEQKLVGNQMRAIDNLITLHQRKLELLRNIKKSLLDRMFV